MSTFDSWNWGYCSHCTREVQMDHLSERLVPHKTNIKPYGGDCDGSHQESATPPAELTAAEEAEGWQR